MPEEIRKTSRALKKICLILYLGIWVVGLANIQAVMAEPLLIPAKAVMSEEKRNNKVFQVAKIIIAAEPEVVFKTLTDYDQAPHIFSNLKSCRVLSSDGVKKRIAFHAIAMNGLLTFDYILEVKEHAPSTIEWHRQSGAFKANEGYWKLESEEKGKFTLVTYSKYVDGGLLLPPFIVRNELRNDMPVILAQLKKAAEARKAAEVQIQSQ